MTTSLRWTSADLELLPDNGKRYEIIEGGLHVSRQPDWCSASGFDEDDVAPDAVWFRKERLPAVLAPDGKLHAAPIE
jgi:Uma2 family endonuclease